MSLTNILNEIETNRPNAEVDVQMGNPDTLGARSGLKRAAVEAIKRLRLDYRNELLKGTAFIVVTGPTRDSFTEVATSDAFGCFSADSDGFYKDLVSRVNPALFGREGARNLFNVVGNVLEDKMLELDIASYPMLAFSDKYNSAVNKSEDLLPLVKAAINDQVGSEIVGVNAIFSIVDRAIEKKHAAEVTPVILSTGDEKFALDLKTNLTRLTSKVFLVVAGKGSKSVQLADSAILVKTVSEESVGDALSGIRNKIL